jgi:hypothetical protein
MGSGSGEGNTGIGAEAMSSLSPGNNASEGHPGKGNTGIGAEAMSNLNTGFYNTALGYRAGQAITVGSNNTLIGYNTNVVASSSPFPWGQINNSTAIGVGAIVDVSNKIRLGNTSVTLVETSGTVSASAFVGDGSQLTNLPSSGSGIIAPVEARFSTLSDSDHGKIFFTEHGNKPAFPDPETLSAGFTCTIVSYSHYKLPMSSPTATIIGTRSNSMYPTQDHTGAVVSNHASNIGGKAYPVSHIGFQTGGTIQIRVIKISGVKFYYVSGDYYYD